MTVHDISYIKTPELQHDINTVIIRATHLTATKNDIHELNIQFR